MLGDVTISRTMTGAAQQQTTPLQPTPQQSAPQESAPQESAPQLAQLQAALRQAAQLHEPSGLRERKKLATRKALGMAAMRLAIERGLDNVLVDDIAEAAGVSARTFNNYFASKYEAICALQQDRAVRIGEALRARPPGEPLWDSVTQAVLSQFGPADGGAAGQPPKDWIAGLRLVVTTPALVGEHLKVQGLAQYHLAAAIAERLGTSTETDMFPRIMAGAVSAAIQAAMERWLHSDPPVPLAPLMRQSLRELADGMREVLPRPPDTADSG
jgi:AcrR family transcriptional regulator